MKVPLPVYDENLFHWDEVDFGVCDASDLTHSPHGGCQAFVIKNARNGNERQFYYSKTFYDAEGDAMAWEYIGADGVTRVHIFND